MIEPTESTSTAKTTTPDRFCDVVMKGGITSGVVYPLAIARLAQRFRFKNIGGTSAGAIAAAATAAAELGREVGGFEKLKGLPDFLGGLSSDRKSTNLFGLFQPQARTQGLFAIATTAIQGGKWKWLNILRTAIRVFPIATIIGSLPSLVLFVPVYAWTHGLFFWICLLCVLVTLLLGTVVALVVAATKQAVLAVPQNFYGLCSGMTEEHYDSVKQPEADAHPIPLTAWLTPYLNELAGRHPKDRPLIFGDLWGSTDQNSERKINLEMMTTCITHGRPYRLPIRQDDDLDENHFYFRPDEFKRLFPKQIVDWLLQHPRPVSGRNDREIDESQKRRLKLAGSGFYPMPLPGDLPVVVAVRMSLSFPILLSAIPLHAIDRKRDPNGERPECCWFSDGGLCSNIPLHFFDSALPCRPTLSINLCEAPKGSNPQDLNPQIVERNEDGIIETWNRFEVVEEVSHLGGDPVLSTKGGLAKLQGFVTALITTMQNWTDNTQSRLPGFRDRIVHVPLTSEEGGLNLTMTKELIGRLTVRGEVAGGILLDRFATNPKHPKMTWSNHRWLRMRSLISCIEKTLNQIDYACAHPEGDDTAFDEWIGSCDDPPCYSWENETQQQLACDTLRRLREMSRLWKDARSTQDNPVSAAGRAPRPRPELRPRAQI